MESFTKENKVKCLNPWDPQSKRQYMIDGVYATLNAGQAIGGQAHGICYAIEGNTVDRISGKNGRGWCEGVSPTLNTQDRHAICFQQNQREEVREMGEQAGALTAESGMHNTNYVCIALEGNGIRPSHQGAGFSSDGTMYTLNTIEKHSVCYTIDCRNLNLNEEKSGTLQGKNTGGCSLNYTNPVLRIKR